MKKLFVCALAVGLFTACSQDETISQQSPMQISFEGAFVENATRATNDPSTTTDNIKGFDVWAFMDEPTGVVFNNEDVTGGKGAWTYTNTQYWAPNHTYYFAAIAPMNSANIDPHTDGANTLGIGATWFRNVDGTEDFLYAATTRTTGASIDAQPDAVKFQFGHMLSKVKFSFTNGFKNDNAFITIKNIKMSVPSMGYIKLNEDKWWEGEKWILHTSESDPNITLEFGDMQTEKVAMGKSEESQNERFTIPANDRQEYHVTFDVELYNGTVLAYSNTLTTVITGTKLEMGKAYDFHAEINDENIMPGSEKLWPITFDAAVTDWVDPWIDYDGKDIKTDVVETLGEEHTTVAADEVLTLEDSYAIAKSLSVAGTLEGNNNTLFSAKTPGNNGIVRPTGTATIKNLTVDGENRVWNDNGTERGLRAFYITSAGTYTIDYVTVEDVTYAINVNTTEEVTLNVTNSTLEGWTSYGSSTTANFTNVKFTTNPDAYGMLRPQGKTYFKNCSFDKDFKFSLDLLKEGITFEGCTWDGAEITSANIDDMISTKYYDGVAADANLDKITYVTE